jgi:prepilin-type N-terminal cleavage/methylation domain-containing protein
MRAAPRAGTRPQKRTREEDGFTLLELVIAMLLMSIAIAGLVGVLGTAFRSTAMDIHRTDATAIAGQGPRELEANPASGPLAPANGSTCPTVPISWCRNHQAYNVSGVIGAATASNGDANAYPTLAVTVSWIDAGGTHRLTQSTARFPGPTTTAVACPPPGPLASAPLYNAVASGDPSLDVSWQEPSGTVVTQWQVQVSPDGTTWTTAVPDERPLAPGQMHQVEIGGLAGVDTYAVQVIALSACAAPQSFPATAGGTPKTPAATSSACTPGSMTLGPPVAERIPTGASAGLLTAGIEVVVTTPAPCASGLWVGAVASGGAVVSTGLTATPSTTGTYSYVGTLPGSTFTWDLGTQQVQVFPGPPAFVLPTSGQVAAAVLCVEEQGSNSC